jgi:protease stability complex PrcB-like protein
MAARHVQYERQFLRDAVNPICLALSGALVILNPVAFTSVHQGTQSQIEDAREVTIRTAPEWQALWKEHAPAAPPRVDFSKMMVVGVFLGTRPTGGYSVEIVSVDATGGEIVVTYRETQPPRDAMLTQALMSPVHLVSIPKQQGTVRFVSQRAQRGRVKLDDKG